MQNVILTTVEPFKYHLSITDQRHGIINQKHKHTEKRIYSKYLFLYFVLKALYIVSGVIDVLLLSRDARANLPVESMDLKHVGLCCFSGLRTLLLRTSYAVPAATQRHLLGTNLHYKQKNELNSEVPIN